MAKGSKTRSGGKRTTRLLAGNANGPLNVEVQVIDPEYLIDALSDDIKYQRVWTDGEADAGGWVVLVYSADGPNGDPWQIGKIRFTFNPKDIDSHLQTLANLSVRRIDE